MQPAPTLPAPTASTTTATGRASNTAASADVVERIPLSSWILATRPKTLVAGAVPVLVGAASTVHLALAGAQQDGVATGLPVHLWLVLPCLFCSLLIQVGTNLFNDVYDFERGADDGARLGPKRVTQSGLIPAHVVKFAAIACFVAAAVCGLVVCAVAGWHLIVVGAVCLFCGWLYTGGPFPLAYHGLGEVFVFVFFGEVATVGSAYAVSGVVDIDAIVCGAIVGALSTGLILVNNLRDVDGDARANKRTLAVRFGVPFSRALYVTGLVAAVAGVVVIGAMRASPWLALPLLALPLAIKAARGVTSTSGAQLNPLLGATARTMTVLGLLLSIALVLS